MLLSKDAKAKDALMINAIPFLQLAPLVVLPLVPVLLLQVETVEILLSNVEIITTSVSMDLHHLIPCVYVMENMAIACGNMVA